MLGYLLSILGLAALCGAWVLFQLWVERSAPPGDKRSLGCCGCDKECSNGEKRFEDTTELSKRQLLSFPRPGSRSRGP